MIYFIKKKKKTIKIITKLIGLTRWSRWCGKSIVMFDINVVISSHMSCNQMWHSNYGYEKPNEIWVIRWRGQISVCSLDKSYHVTSVAFEYSECVEYMILFLPACSHYMLLSYGKEQCDCCVPWINKIFWAVNLFFFNMTVTNLDTSLCSLSSYSVIYEMLHFHWHRHSHEHLSYRSSNYCWRLNSKFVFIKMKMNNLTLFSISSMKTSFSTSFFSPAISYGFLFCLCMCGFLPAASLNFLLRI